MSFEGSVDDRLAIRELVDSYGDAVSRQDAADWGANWMEKSVWALNLPALPKIEGRANIVALWSKAMADYEYVLMTATPGYIRVTGDAATGRFWTSETMRLKTGEGSHVVGRFDDEYLKQNGRWYFKSRDYKLVHRQSLPPR